MLFRSVHCADFTTPYPGISELLRQLQADGVVSAVVSNKPDYAVKTLSAQYFPGLLAASAGAKDGVRKKPCPDAVFEVVRQLGAEALRAVYIGDSEVDVATARNAGLPCISVSWGFRDRVHTQKQLADEMGISQSYISRLEKRILSKIRKEMLRECAKS